jgi:lipopolysaccharide export system protein LptA
MVKTAAGPGKPGAAPAKAVPAAAKSSAGPPNTAGGESKISRVDAQGHVVITNGPDTGRGDYGVYNADTGIATLIDNVVIERGKDVIRGQRGVMDLNNNVSRMLPAAGTPSASGAPHQRVQGLFVREDAAGRAAAKPGAGPNAPAGDKRP